MSRITSNPLEEVASFFARGPSREEIYDTTRIGERNPYVLCVGRMRHERDLYSRCSAARRDRAGEESLRILGYP